MNNSKNVDNKSNRSKLKNKLSVKIATNRNVDKRITTQRSSDNFSQVTQDLKSNRSKSKSGKKQRTAPTRKVTSTKDLNHSTGGFITGSTNKFPEEKEEKSGQPDNIKEEADGEDFSPAVHKTHNEEKAVRHKNSKPQKSAEEYSQMDDDESSFDASLSDDEDEDSDEDDFVTAQEFQQFQDESRKEISELKQLCDKAIQQNIRLLRKIDKVDWNIVNQAEGKLANVLGEFQLSVDGLLMAIEHDIKQWKRQRAEMETKFESLTLQLKSQTSVSNFLKEEFFSNQTETQGMQEKVFRFLQMQVALAESDEHDKQNISLIGQKEVIDQVKHPETQHDKDQILSLDPFCKACQCESTIERTYMLKNLKLACLMYNPSPVQIPDFPNTQIPRSEVVDIQRTLQEELFQLSEQRR